MARQKQLQRSASSAPLLKEAARKAKPQKYVLRLYIVGLTPSALETLRTVAAVCEEELEGRCDLKVIDLTEQPKLAKGEQIVAVPTLIKKLPPPLRRFIGSLADKERLLVGLDLRPKEEEERRHE